MSKREKYKTVAAESETLIIEKKSKFISHVKPVDNEADALAYLNEIRSKYADARHNVYAYVIDENNIFRYSDDGEPSGTAGMPVLDTIRKSSIVDVVVVITRYFGGTLLGTGGLVHTYSASAKKGLEESGIIIRTMCDIISVRISYELVGKIQYTLAQEGITIENTLYENDVTFLISSPKDDTERIMAKLTDITNGKAVMKIIDQKYVDKEEDKNGD
ncbi:MAG: YigZ family protein [Oscillospiraceae bacterium]|nr:YigZ family protein [Oscillospiraceae bacterium]